MAHIEDDLRTGELKIAMKLKVKTPVSLTEQQQSTLQRLGCEAKPFITWPHTLIFAATVTAEQEQELRNLEYVTEVEPMPTYGFR